MKDYNLQTHDILSQESATAFLVSSSSGAAKRLWVHSRKGALIKGAIPKAGKIRQVRAMAVFKYSALIKFHRSDGCETCDTLYQFKPSRCNGALNHCMAVGQTNCAMVLAPEISAPAKASATVGATLNDANTVMESRQAKAKIDLAGTGRGVP